MSRYHVNPETGRPNLCRAQTPEACLYYNSETGVEAPHFESKEEARSYAEGEMNKELGETKSLSKKSVTKKSDFVEPGVKRTEGYMGQPGWVGNKVTGRYMPTKEIVKNIRNDIKLAEEAGYLPKGYKYSVRKQGYNSINVEINGLPKDEEKFDYKIRPTGYGGDSYEVIPELKPEYKEIQEKVKAISDSYNYNESNAMVDYFDRGFYGQVVIPTDSEVAWNKAEAAERKTRTVANKLKKEGLTKEEIIKRPEFLSARENYYKLARSYKIESTRQNAFYETVRKTGVIDKNAIEELTKQKLAEHDAKYGKNKEL